MPVEALAGRELQNLPLMWAQAPPRMALLQTCLLVVTWQRCWHGNDVEKLNSAWTTDKVYMEKFSQHCTTAEKNDTGVSPRYSYKLFLYLLFYIPEMTNLTMLFNVLLTTFYFIFFMVSGHASNNPFQVVYFCFTIKVTIYPDLKIVLFSQLTFVICCNSHFVFGAECSFFSFFFLDTLKMFTV